ncbi:MAG: 2-hydroxyacid dehydrogenase [Halanaerobiales bacterium]
MKIVMLEPISVSNQVLKKYGEKFEKMGHEFITYDDRVEDDDILIERAKDAEVLIITNLPLSAKVINSCTKLKMISVAFTGIDHIAMDVCRKTDITICNSSGYANQAVAELVFGFLINIMRNMLPCDQVTREGKTRAGLVGNEIAGKKFGVVGTGAIGMRVIEIAKAFGCEILANDINENEKALELGVKYLDIDSLMSESDVITLHVPLMDSTRNLIDQEKINLMKENAIIINCARGPVVDSEALADALNKGKIAGAGIDVFEMEPPIPANHPLLNSKSTLLTPHVAFASEESFVKRADIVFNNIEKWLEGNPQNVME